ncbi:unnamed protein product [Lota lota]
MTGGDGAQYDPPPLKPRANKSGMKDSNRPPVASSAPTLRRKKRTGRQREQRVTFVLEEQDENSPAAQLEPLTTCLSTSTGVTEASEEHLRTQGRLSVDAPWEAFAVKGKPDDPMDSDLSDYDNETSTMCSELTCGPIGVQEDCHSVLCSPVGVPYSAAAAVREDEELEMEVVMGRVSLASVDWTGVEHGGASRRLPLSPALHESFIRMEVRSAAPIQTSTCYGHQREPSDCTLLQSQVGLQRNHSPDHPPVDKCCVLGGVISEKIEPSANKRSCDYKSSSEWPKNIPPTLTCALPLTLSEILDASPRSLSRSLEDILPILSPMFSSCPCIRVPGHCTPSLSGHNREDNSEVQQEWTTPVADGVHPLMNESSESDSTVTDQNKDVQGNSTTSTSAGLKLLLNEHNLNRTVVAQQEGASLPFALSSDEALRKQEEIWQREVEESLLSSRPRCPLQGIAAHQGADEVHANIPTPTPPQRLPSEADTSGDGEERTPGRLQAIWPPIKDEKVGLKYTEAEHQAALLQLKRECKEEVEKLQEDHGRALSRLREEHEENVSQLECTLARLHAQRTLAEAHRRGDLRDACVSTEDDVPRKVFRTVCIQTDRETFIRAPDGNGGGYMSAQQQMAHPKKLDLASISINLVGQREDHTPPMNLPSPSSSSSSPSPSPSSSSSSLPPLPPAHSAVPPVPVSTHPALPLSNRTSTAPPPPPPPLPPPLPLPPPPPMAGLGFPPPPPPPPLGQGSVLAVDIPPRKPAIEPSVPMKPLYWTRIQIQDNKSDSLWNSLEPPSLINNEEFEDLFAKGMTQANRKPLAEAYEKKAKTRKIVKLLDAKRSQAVGIFISSLHLEMKDIKHAVLMVNNSLVDLETIEALYENRPQPEEVERIRNHYETSDQEHIKLLDKPEQFLYELSQIPDFAGRAHCIIFQSAFNDTIDSVHRKVQIVSSVCTALREGPGVREVVALVLALGNHMNGGSRVRGQADGFGLEILPKLKDVKSRDQRMSLVDYVVSYYLHNVDQDAGTDRSVFPLPEPQDLFLAGQVKMDDLTRDLRKLRQDLTVCEKDVLKVSSTSPEEYRQPFQDTMEAFLLTGEHMQLTITQRSFEEVVRYFGVSPKAGESEVSTAHFFLLWFEFCADFKTRWKKESKNFSKERLKEAQQSVKRITADKKVDIRQVNPNSLKDRLRQKDRKSSH